jgi:exodeoxyribonuclease VII large subunit
LIDVAHAVHRRTNGAVTRAEERTGERARRVDTSARAVLDRAEARLGNVAGALRNRPTQALTSEARHIDSIESRVRLLDPVVLLQRGWSITRDAEGHVVRDVGAVRAGDRLVTHFAAGTVASTVDDVTVLPPADAGPPISTDQTSPTGIEGAGDE